ncbi:MAG: hypothetical protein OEX12_03240 [Gammaproteobacteria bacterium]|nr:hypothetical protein [Gammaproteobacteria bacterium]
MNKTRFSVISRSGLGLLLLWLSVAILLALLSHWIFSLPVVLLLFMTAYLYRDLPRTLPAKPLAILSPLDGKIISCEPADDPYVDRHAICLQTQTHALGPFVLRAPMEGKIVKQWFSPAGKDMDGKRTSAVMAMWIRSDEDDDVVVVISPLYRWTRIVCWSQAGERVGQGRRCGFIPLGAKIEVFLPDNARIKVDAGQSVTAGDNILAELVHK